ncbi:glycosyltransferase [Candidatus Saccharibacteria bacterium]|nr:glycosyltransferase [Candidatus Saccharibacteria bacterium]
MIKKKILITIIIPCYNSGKTIEKCIRSVCRQTYKKIEIICINDYSNDNTANIIKQIAKTDKRVTLIEHNKNLGVSVCRNEGISKAKGDYVTFLDSDDFIEKNTVETLVNCVDNNNRPDFIRYNFTSTNNSYDNNLHDLNNRFLGSARDKKEIYQAFFVNKQRIPTYVWLLIIKKEIVKQIKFDPNISYLEDTLFYYDLITIAKTCLFLNAPLYHYVDNNTSLTRSKDNLVKKINNVLYVCNEITTWKNLSLPERKITVAHLLNLASAFLLKLGMLDYATYKTTFTELHYDSTFRKIVRYGNLGEINKAKRIYIKTIYLNKRACLTRPFLWIKKMRYNQ